MIRSVCLVLGIAAGIARADGVYVWWEAESPESANFPATTAKVAGAAELAKERLSAGEWLTNAGKRAGPEAFARYRVRVPAAGEYSVWCRKRPGLGAFRWRFDEMEWAVSPEDAGHADRVFVGGAVDVGWVFLGRTTLAEGDRDFEMRLLAAEGESLLSGYDCFVLSRDLFFPRGTLRPGEILGQAEAGRFPWEPAEDSFGPGALFDLRSLNERFAGEHGFIRREGRDLVRGDGVPVRFWGVVAGADAIRLDRASVDYLARSLAKRGVNAVRCRFPVWGEKSADVDAKRLDELFYFFAALKREGIYSALGFYDPGWLSFRPGYGPVGYEELDVKHPFTLVFHDPGVQDMWRTWATAALRTVNPHTGKTLGDDPALALVEIAGNDSLFSANLNKRSVPVACWSRLERIYGSWLVGRYGAAERVRQAWMEAREPGDDPDNGRFAIYEDWRMTREGMKSAGPGMRRRLADQVRFLAGIQEGFFMQATEYLRRDLGVRCPVRAGDASVSDPELLSALDRGTRAASGVTGDRGSFSGGTVGGGPDAGEDVMPGIEFKNLSALGAPERVPLGAVQAERYPAIITDVYWANPNQYRSDFTFLAAACAGAQGVDGVFTSVLTGSSWEPRMTIRGLYTPVILGGFPAFALAYRRGDISEATDAVARVFDPERLYALKGSGASEAGAGRASLATGASEAGPAAGAGAGESVAVALGIDPLAFAAMRVVCSYSDTGAPVRSDPSPAVDRNLKVIRNSAGELVWDYGKGVARLDTERIKAAAGFLSQFEKIRMGSVEIESENDYAVIALVSMDGQPLEFSRTILIQAVTTQRPYGLKTSAGSEGRIDDPGGWPFGVERIRARVAIRLEQVDSERPIEVIALDANGYPRGEKVPAVGGRSGEALVIKLLEDSIYYIVRR